VRQFDDDRELLRVPHPGFSFWHATTDFTHDGRYLLICYFPEKARKFDALLHVWHLERRERVSTHEIRSYDVIGAVATHNRHLLFVNRQSELCVWDLELGREQKRLPLGMTPYGICVDAEGRRVAVNDSTTPHVRISDLENGHELASWSTNVGTRAMAWSTDGQLLASGHEDGSIFVRHVPRGELLAELEGEVIRMAFARRGYLLATSGWNRSTQLWRGCRGPATVGRHLCWFGHNAFFLAMARWQLDDPSTAHDWYARAVAWLEKNQAGNSQDEEELESFRAEAEELRAILGPTPQWDANGCAQSNAFDVEIGSDGLPVVSFATFQAPSPLSAGPFHFLHLAKLSNQGVPVFDTIMPVLDVPNHSWPYQFFSVHLVMNGAGGTFATYSAARTTSDGGIAVDPFITKVAADGTVEFTKQFFFPVSDIAIDNDQNIYVATSTSRNATRGEYFPLITLVDDSGGFFSAPLIAKVEPDVTNLVSAVGSGLVYNPAIDRFVGQLTITNTSAGDIAGPFFAVFHDLPAGVTLAFAPARPIAALLAVRSTASHAGRSDAESSRGTARNEIRAALARTYIAHDEAIRRILGQRPGRHHSEVRFGSQSDGTMSNQKRCSSTRRRSCHPAERTEIGL
jgi:hypothetical protein